LVCVNDRNSLGGDRIEQFWSATVPVNVYLLLVDLALAVVAGLLVRRNRRPRAVSERTDKADRIASLVRIGRVGDPEFADPVRSSVRIAPSDDSASALEVFGADGAHVTSIGAGEVVMARCWSGGRQVVSLGSPRPVYGPFWPLGPNVAGWEIHLVSAEGATLRCYGAPGTSLGDELARLESRIRAVPLARAS
jgi:hypothetical protein